MKKIFYSYFTRWAVFLICCFLTFCFTIHCSRLLKIASQYDLPIDINTSSFENSSYFRNICNDYTSELINSAEKLAAGKSENYLNTIPFDGGVKYYFSFNSGEVYTNLNEDESSFRDMDKYWLMNVGKPVEGAETTEEINPNVKYAYQDLDEQNMTEAFSVEDILDISDINETYSDNIFVENKGLDSFYLDNNAKFMPGDKIYIGFTADNFSAEKELWTAQRDEAKNIIEGHFVLGFLILMGLIYMTMVTGRKADTKDIRLWRFDGIYGEVILFLGLCIGCLGIFGAIFGIIEAARSDEIMVSMWADLGAASAVVTFALLTWLWLSLVRSAKARTLTKRFLIWRIAVWLYNKPIRAGIGIFRGFYEDLKNIRNKKAGLNGILFVAGCAVAAFLALFIGLVVESGFLIVLLEVLVTVGACALAVRFVRGLDEIAIGAEKVRSGDVSYRIPELKNPYFNKIGQDINRISEGAEINIEKGIRSERMKAELITNVSHDLKTPLTSIINFSKLLCEQELSPTEANDYAKIIYEKSLRLKNLTSDLFDISKVQSGNEIMDLKDINMCLLVKQSMAEYEKAIAESELEFITELPEEEIIINADGKKLSRVLGNLIENALKYAMKNTRVYVTIYKKDDKAVFEIKNISAERIRKSADEIVERFVRGDESRSEEGSGLGLAIAKSYTEANKGSFELTIDGDFFKATLRFKSL